MNKIRPVNHPIMNSIGIILFFGSLWLTGRLIYERTFLTWEEGPQMVAFYLAHSMYLILLFGAISFYGAHLWLIWLLYIGFRTPKLVKAEDLVVANLLLVVIIAGHIPDNCLQYFMIKFYGPGKHGGDLLINNAARGHYMVVESLLDQGVPVNVVGVGGATPILAASLKGDERIVKLLILKGADLNVRDIAGGTALMSAAESDSPEVIELLLKSGIDPSIKNNEGMTALDIAIELGKEDNARVLRKAMK